MSQIPVLAAVSSGCDVDASVTCFSPLASDLTLNETALNGTSQYHRSHQQLNPPPLLPRPSYGHNLDSASSGKATVLRDVGLGTKATTALRADVITARGDENKENIDHCSGGREQRPPEGFIKQGLGRVNSAPVAAVTRSPGNKVNKNTTITLGPQDTEQKYVNISKKYNSNLT